MIKPDMEEESPELEQQPKIGDQLIFELWT
jgi:hypothetical protein